MIEGLFHSGSVQSRERLVQFTGQRHTVLANNIANISTPRFRPGDLDVKAFQAELGSYSDELAAKPELIALSKMELVGDAEDRAAAVAMVEAELGQPVIGISAVTGEGLGELLEACWSRLGKDEAEQTKWSL